MGIGAPVGNIRFSWSAAGMGVSGRCPVQLEFDIFDPSDRLIDSLASPDYSVRVKCPELEIEAGSYFIDSRSVSGGVCHVVCYDRLSRADASFTTNHNWKKEPTMKCGAVLSDICKICGFEGVYGATFDYVTFKQEDVSGKTCGELLDMISAVFVGIFVCFGQSLSFVPLGGASGTSVGCYANTEIEYQGKTAVQGLVMKNSTTGAVYSYGSTNGNGYVVQVESGLVTAFLAQIAWQRLSDQKYTYTAWNCEKAEITANKFTFAGPLQFTPNGGASDSLGDILFPRQVEYAVDSTGIYFSGGCPPVDEWNYKSKLEREKIGIGKAVGNTSISEGGRVNFINLNLETE
ncbi:MAG: hypothetical protein NC085_01535 [Muribaculaceae bacterium]|nr:hypothetical protein [Muribaculaceae bacterium]MCM1478348.1 hypothetical protein [Muribaculaceae bacterium]